MNFQASAARYHGGLALGYLLLDAPDNAEWQISNLDDAELHRVARAADALAALCYAKAGPRADALPAAPAVEA